MIETFLITFFVLLFIIFIMSIGYVIAKKKITGSCGGLGKMTGLGVACMLCEKKSECKD